MKSYSENGKENQETKQNMQSFKKQILSADLWISSAAECLATFIFLFVSCLSLMFPESIGGKDLLKSLFLVLSYIFKIFIFCKDQVPPFE